MRKFYKPMLAQTAEAPFNSKEWIFEIKWDGIRAISYINDESSLRSRNNKELKQNFPELEELRNLAKNVVLDGEIIVLQNGICDFQTVIEKSKITSKRDIERLAQEFPATYVVFDILEKDGKQVIDLPLIERKKILDKALKEGKHVVLSVFVEEDGELYYREAIKKGMEGVMAKKKDSSYKPGLRSENWLKIKKLRSCDCVIFGYTAGKGERKTDFGALILGLFDGKKPTFIGKVGTGFSGDVMTELMKSFHKIVSYEPTVEVIGVSEKITWLKPELVCEVIYQVVTKDLKLRMPRFRTIRTDKKPLECTLDQIRPKTLGEYKSKRDFSVSPEPQGESETSSTRIFVVQEHHARRLHYDLRLEKDGVLKSWAVPKGIPEKPGDKRLAVQVEDHPYDYAKFEGTIPEGQYGAGLVTIWDKGTYDTKIWNEDMIEFILHGQRLNGRCVLTRFKKAGENNWLLLKTKE